MKRSAEYLSVLPEPYSSEISRQPAEGLEEIRMRAGQPAVLHFADRDLKVWPKVEPHHLEEVIQRACHHSAYTCAESLSEGFLTIEGGHRIGVCGAGFIRGDGIRTIRMPSSISLRIAGQVYGCAEKLLPHLTKSTLILGPPGRGKTTLLRDAVVMLSDRKRQRVCLVDERGELAACVHGMPQLNIGERTDVLVNIRKDAAIMMLLRTMNPQWIAVDEITAERDIFAMEQASYCGVNILATAHAETVTDLRKRPLYLRLLGMAVFSQAVILHPDRSYHMEEIAL